MADCTKCGKKIGFFGGSDGLCSDCATAERDRKAEALEKEINDKRLRAIEEEKKKKDAARIKNEKVQSVILTTEVASNLKISERKTILIAHADCAFDVKLQQKKDELLNNLKEQAYDCGANAVVGITFSVEESYSASIGSGNVKLFKLISYGTAVTIE